VSPRFIPLFAWLLLSTGLAAARPHSTPAPEKRIQVDLSRIVLPKLEFQETMFPDAVKKLNDDARRYDPRGRGVPIFADVLSSSAHVPTTPTTGEPVVTPTEVKITVSLTKIPLLEALKYVAGLANCKFWIRADGVHIVALDEPEPLIEETFRIPAGFFPAFEKQDRIDHTNETAKMKENFRQYLIERGIAFPEGAEASLTRNETLLTVHLTKDQIPKVEKLLNTDRPAVAFPVPGSDVPKGMDTPRGLPNLEYLIDDDQQRKELGWVKKKLRKIVLPHIVLKDVHLATAITTLREMSVRYDKSAKGAARGIQLYLHIYTESMEDFILVSYQGENVRLGHALETIARSIHRRIAVVGPQIWLYRDINLPNEVRMRTYLIPPGIASLPTKLKLPPSADRQMANGWLKNAAISTFPDPFEQLYLPSKRRLFVYGSDAKQKEVEDQVEECWRAYYVRAPRDRTRNRRATKHDND
jgi:hypothetical protein